MHNSKKAATPLPAGYVPIRSETVASPELRSKYQTVIGSLLYLMLGTRPDIAFAVTKMAQFAANPSEDHLNRALYICRYLVGTQSYRLTYDGGAGQGLSATTDSDWAADANNRRSQTGFFLRLAGAPISWTSRAQKPSLSRRQKPNTWHCPIVADKSSGCIHFWGSLAIPSSPSRSAEITKARSLSPQTLSQKRGRNISTSATTMCVRS
jgi:hypothetical protein